MRATGSATVYLFADAAFLSWFARESPSTALGGLYDAAGIFPSVLGHLLKPVWAANTTGPAELCMCLGLEASS